MDKYIIYAGGKNGYRLYDAHPQFPEEYRALVESLYTQQRIVDDGEPQGNRRCYRFAALGEGYVLSIIYKGCFCREEGRTIFATVNWVFSAQEADVLFQTQFREVFSTYIRQSDRILQERGYEIPSADVIPADGEAVLSGEIKQAMLSAVYGAAAAKKEKRIRMQVLIGRNAERGLFDDLFILLDSLPVYMRKTLSFHLGFSAVSELGDVVLAITSNDALRYIVSTGRYGGAMATVNQRIALLDGRFTEVSVLPPAVEEYEKLTSEQRQRVNALFCRSENAAGYWDYIHSLASDGEGLQGSALIDALGEGAFLDGLSVGLFSDDELVQMYAQRDAVASMAEVMRALEKFAKPLYAQRIAEQEVLRRAAQEKSDTSSCDKKPRHKGKNTKKPTGKKQDETEPKPQEDKCARSVDMKEELAVLRRVIAPMLAVLLFLLVFALFCGGMFLLGVMVVARLKAPWSYVTYGAQLALTVLISMVSGYLVLSYFGKRFSRRTDKTEDERL